MKNIPIGQMLLESNHITQAQLDGALAYQKENPGMRLGDVLIHLGYIKEEDRLKALSARLNVPIYEGYEINVTSEVSGMISEQIARKYSVMPLEVKNNMLVIAMHDPLDFYALEEIKATCGIPVVPMLAPTSMILNAISRNYSAVNVSDAILEMNREFGESTATTSFVDSKQRIDNAPLVKFVNNLVRQAYDQGASDIHIEPFDKYISIRIRIDGVLKEFTNISKNTQDPLITRLKIIGGMNIAEKRVPQDGRIDMIIDGKEVDIRISTIPTIHGEKIVIRLLGHSLQDLTTMEDLGLDEQNKELLAHFIQSPHGIILVTGPTGSGKTTSLYAVLNGLMSPQVNIVTVEDPVEKRINGINQVQVNAKTGLTFANGLRSILRQDPDIIMIGEIRDEETAKIAVRSAITGHLVLSTIHTNDSVTAIARLRDMGVEPYLIASSLVGIVAQRLARRICVHCREEATPNIKERQLLDHYPGQIYKAKGCPKCNGLGYQGRIAIFEMLPVDYKVKEMISSNASITSIREYALSQGMTTLLRSMQILVVEGVTTMDEMIRVTYDM